MPCPTPPPEPVSAAPSLSVGCANICGLVTRREEVEALLAMESLDVLLVQETLTGRKTVEADVAVADYTCFRKDRKGRSGGGVAVFIANTLAAAPITLPESLKWEFAAVQVHAAGGSIAASVVSLYRPPGLSAAQSEAWAEELGIVLAWVVAEECAGCADGDPGGAPLIVGGDFNSDWRMSESAMLRALLAQWGLRTMDPSSAPTHGQRLLDVLLTCAPVARPVSRLPPLEKKVSGHQVLLAAVELPKKPLSQAALPRPRWRWRDGDWEHVAQVLQRDSLGRPAPILRRLGDGSVNDQVLELENQLWMAFKEGVPLSRPGRRRRKYAQWIRPSALRAIHDARIAWRTWKETGDACHQRKAQRLRDKKKWAVRDAKREWVQGVVEKATSRGRVQEIPKLLRGRARAPLPPLATPTVTATTDSGKVLLLATQFKSVFGKSDQEAEDLAVSNAREEAVQARPVPVAADEDSAPDHPLPQAPDDPLRPVSQGEVLLEFSRARRGTAPGADGLPLAALKPLRFILAPVLAALYTRCPQTESWPERWKESMVVPVQKIRNAKSPEQYRPISLLCIAGKLLEGIILRRLKPYLPESSDQFGFKGATGTDDALLRLLLKIIEPASCNPSEPLRVLVVSLDAKKAFDSVRFEAILGALGGQGCPAGLLHLLCSWMRARPACVTIGAARSFSYQATTGVAQGSRLGPALYNAATDAVLRLNLSEGTHLQFYADDGLLLRHLRTPEDQGVLEQDVAEVVRALGTLGLCINPKKSQVCLLRLRQGPGHPGLPRPFAIGDSKLDPVPAFRYLGIDVDAGLTFGLHWASVIGRVKGMVSSLGRLLRGHQAALRVATEAVVQGSLLHSLKVCPPALATTWLALERLRRYQARTILGLGRHDGGGPELLHAAGVTTARWLHEFHGLRLLWTCWQGSRHYGRWLSPADPDKRVLRSEAPVIFPQIHIPMHPRLQRLQVLTPASLPAKWNNLPFAQTNIDPVAALQSLPAFSEALHSLLPPPEQL